MNKCKIRYEENIINNKLNFKERLKAGEHLIGSWIMFTDPCVTEVMAGAGFDFLIVEMEHSAQNLETVQRHIIAMKGTNTTPIVRVPWNDPVMIKQVLDMGTAGILVPQVRTAEEAKQAVSSCLYPPEGIRGFGPRRPGGYERNYKEYIKTANKNIVIFIQLEHIDAVNNIDKILNVAGIDAICIGQCDLSGSLGLLGDINHPKVIKAVETIIAKSNKAKIPVGHMVGIDVDKACEWIKKGVQFVAIGSDMSYLVKTTDDTVAQLRKLL